MDHTTLACCSLAFVLYYNTLDAGFVYDDSRAILTNQDVLPSTPVSSVWQDDFWGTPLTHSGSHKSYRPLTVLSFRLNYLAGGFRPSGYHLVNVLLHCAATALVVRLAKVLFGHRRIFAVLVSGILFASHPVHTEAVAGVVGRADVGACIFFLLSFLSYVSHVRYRDKSEIIEGEEALLAAASRKWSYLAACLLFATCAILTKEQGITVLVVCALYDLILHLRKDPEFSLRDLFTKRGHRGLAESLVCLGATLTGLLQLRLYIMGSQPPEFASSDNPAARSTSIETRFLTFAYLPVINLGLLIWPKWLSFDWSMDAIPRVKSITDPRNILSCIFYYLLIRVSYKLYLILRHRRRRRTCLQRLFYQQQQRWTTRKNCCSTCTVCRFQGSPTISNHHNHHVCHNNNNLSTVKLSTSYRRCGIFTTTTTASTDLSTLKTLRRKNDNINNNKLNSAEITLLSLAFLTVPFIPATNLFFYVGFVIAERVLYIPSVGYCLLLGLGSWEIWRRVSSEPAKKRALLVTGLVLLAAFSVRTVRRNRDWACEESLYRSGIPINPPKSYGNLGNVLSSQGRLTEAEWAYRMALHHRSNMADVHYNLGILLQGRAKFEDAIQSYRRAIQYRPRLAVAHLNLAHTMVQAGRSNEALEVYRRCAQLDGTGLKDPRTHEATKISALFHLGRLHADEGRFQDAVLVYREAIDKMPDYYQAQSLYNMLGEAHYRLKQYSEAERWYKAALQVKPDHVPAHLTYGKMLAKNKTRLLEAEHWFLKAKELAPNDSSVYQHFGQFLSELDRHDEAAKHYVRAAELAPDDYEIVFNAANALRQASNNMDAERFYRQAVSLRSDDARSHMNLGAMLHVNGKYAQAEEAYLEALRLKPDDETTLTNLQKLYGLMARLQPAPTTAVPTKK